NGLRELFRIDHRNPSFLECGAVPPSIPETFFTPLAYPLIVINLPVPTRAELVRVVFQSLFGLASQMRRFLNEAESPLTEMAKPPRVMNAPTIVPSAGGWAI